MKILEESSEIFQFSGILFPSNRNYCLAHILVFAVAISSCLLHLLAAASSKDLTVTLLLLPLMIEMRTFAAQFCPQISVQQQRQYPEVEEKDLAKIIISAGGEAG